MARLLADGPGGLYLQRLAIEGITDRPNREIPNRKKTRMHTRLSCKIDYLLAQIIAIDQSLPNSSRTTNSVPQTCPH